MEYSLKSSVWESWEISSKERADEERAEADARAEPEAERADAERADVKSHEVEGRAEPEADARADPNSCERRANEAISFNTFFRKNTGERATHIQHRIVFLRRGLFLRLRLRRFFRLRHREFRADTSARVKVLHSFS